jgi:hypothetical protein
MTTESPPDAAAESSVGANASPARGRWFPFAIVIIAVWIAFLAVLTWRTANPPVVNDVQILESDEIFVGSWKDQAEGRFDVADELRHGQIHGLVTITGVPQRGAPKSDRWVIPVTRRGGTYAVTQGIFPPGRDPLAKPGDRPLPPVHVEPLCYPATEAVLAQIRRLLPQKPN